MKREIIVTMPDGSLYPVRKLLGDERSNVKLNKSRKAAKGFRTFGLSLAPAKTSGYNVCQFATAGCSNACIFYTGQGRFANVQRGRIAKTRAFFQDRESFRSMLFAELFNARKLALKNGQKLAVRLNVLSDIPWERTFPDLFTEFSDVQFYDYTKRPGRVTPANYHLTFSRSESNEASAKLEASRGRNVAVVFSGKDIPATWNGVRVFSGDENDLRFLDPRGIVGLYVKGPTTAAKVAAVASGFVIPLRKVG